MGGSINRREFLGASAAGAGAMFLSGHLGSRLAMAAEGADWPPKMPPVKIYKVYIGSTGGIYLSRPTDEIKKFDDYNQAQEFVKKFNSEDKSIPQIFEYASVIVNF